MKATKIILLTMFVLTQIVFPKQITFNEAQIVAENWTFDLEENFNDQVRISDGREIFRENIIVAYVFDLYPKGFVIISPQDYLPPIKFYTLSNNFDKTGLFVQDVIFDGNKEIIKRVNIGKLVPEKSFKSRNMKNFRHYLREETNEDTLSSLNAAVESVEPLLYTAWGQGDPYNAFCPIVEGELTMTGCVPNAIAQIFNFYEWPLRGSGTETYYDNYSKQTLTTNFDKEYEWWNMRDSYNNDERTDQEKDAVATLMFDIGVALHSKYGFYGTGTFHTHYDNLVKHFLYSSDLQIVYYGDYNNIDKWFNIAKNQIDNGWPVDYSIWGTGGHEVVIDGYRIDNNRKEVHINRGGGLNGYYTMDNIDGYPDIHPQIMAINIYPYIGYKLPVALPPTNISAKASLNRSVFLSEHIVKLSWLETPSKDNRVSKYIIYQRNNGEVEIIDRVDPETKNYEFRSKELFEYSVGVYDRNHAYSEIPAFITPVVK